MTQLASTPLTPGTVAKIPGWQLMLPALALALSACGSSATPAPTTPPVASAAPPVAPAAPTAALLQSIASGNESLDAHLDATRGVLFVERYSDASGENPRANASGEVEIAERLCSAALTERLERLRTDWRGRFEVNGAEAMVCAGEACTHHAEMEYDVDARVVFRGGPNGAILLDRVVRIEGGPVSDEWRTAAERWAHDRETELASGVCP